ncbi:NADH:flavin oxidoreductase/NADH oxidase [Corynebacterium sp. SA-MJD20WY100]|uniref:NADH:flavin oxidoreductase/NADH oxidase n=1 Tax=Corynebacterium sp. SA-MJD20WY100 TaxID=3142969 RepID=UPI0032216093
MSNTLFSSWTIRDLELKNRVVLPPMCQYAVDAEDGVVGQWHRVHYGARAAGGFGLVIAEATAVVPEGRISPRDAGIWNDEQVAAWSQVTDIIHAMGAKAGIQLGHAGRKASTYPMLPEQPNGTVPESESGWEPVAPSAISFGEGFAVPRELTTEEVAAIPQAFAAAARRAVDAGFDALEIHGAHGYLIHQFLDPISNQRTDRYGENRQLLALEVIEAIRAAVPEETPLIMRVSATDWLEDDAHSWRVADTVELARAAKERGVDVMHVSTGGNVITDIPTGPGYQAPFARMVREEADIPTIAVGMITDPRLASYLVSSETADAVAVGRAALYNPSWPQAAANSLGIDVAAPSVARPKYYFRGTFR